MLNTTNLQGVIQNLQSRVVPLGTKSGAHQPALDAAVNQLVSVDGELANILTAPDGVRKDIDFTRLNNAVAAFEQSQANTQNDADALAGLIQRNTAK
jgi:hypothetical protein